MIDSEEGDQTDTESTPEFLDDLDVLEVDVGVLGRVHHSHDCVHCNWRQLAGVL